MAGGALGRQQRREGPQQVPLAARRHAGRLQATEEGVEGGEGVLHPPLERPGCVPRCPLLPGPVNGDLRSLDEVLLPLPEGFQRLCWLPSIFSRQAPTQSLKRLSVLVPDQQQLGGLAHIGVWSHDCREKNFSPLSVSW